MMRIRPGDGMDTVHYSWVPLWNLDQKLLKEIKGLEADIAEIRQGPRAKAEIPEAVQGVLAGLESLRVQALQEILADYQAGKIGSLTPAHFAQVWLAPNHGTVSPAHTVAHDFMALLAPEVIQEAMKNLPEGVPAKEKEAKIKALEAKIEKLKARIETECWPDSRKVFNDMGQSIPGQDRWEVLVKAWKQMSRGYSEPVDFEGYKIDKGSPAWKAFHDLGFVASGSATPPKRRTVAQVADLQGQSAAELG